MKPYGALRGASLRNHRRLLRCIADQPEQVVYVRTETEFRMAERLHRAGLLTACISKWSWFGPDHGRPFRELALFLREDKARRRYSQVLPRRRTS